MHLLVLVSLTQLAFSPHALADRRPNIVFILADDLGYTDLGCMGSKYYETPNIDRLAAQGMKFSSFAVCQNCAPTRAALMTGQYSPRTGVYTVGSIGRFRWQTRPLRPVDNVEDLPLDKVTVAQALKAAGYATGLFGKWHLGNDEKHHPRARGFEEAIVSMGKHFNFVTHPKVDYPAGQYLADFLTDKALDFIQRYKDRPFFLYVPHFAVHSPHDAKKELVPKYEKKPPAGGHNNPVYAAMIQSVDESVGRIVARLDELGLSDNTLVIFSSDNGGVGGYGEIGIRGITDNAPLRGGKGMLYEGGIRVPFVVRWPGVAKADSVCDEPTTDVDFYPTCVDVAGAKPDPMHVLDGVSLVPLLKSGGSAKLQRDAIYRHFPGYLGSGPGIWRTTPVGVIRSADWKLMEFFEDGRLELYDLKEDIGEKNNLAARMPDKAKQLHEKLVIWRKAVSAPMPSPHNPETTSSTDRKKEGGKRRAAKSQQ